MTRSSRILHLIAHNVRSAENVGSLFRTCDSLGVEKLWLTGYSPTPDHPRVEKTALGAERSVVWEQSTDVEDVIRRLKADGVAVVGLETDRRALNLLDYRAPERVALLLGNEVEGVAPSLLDLCDEIVCIEQCGTKESLNVSVAGAIAAFWMLNAR